MYKKNKTLIFALMLISVFSAFPQSPAADPVLEEIRSLNKRITELYRGKKFAEAVPLARNATELIEKRFGEDSYELALSFSNLGRVLYEIEGDTKAEGAIQRAVKILKKIKNPDQKAKELLASNMELAAQLKERREFSFAESALEEAAEYRTGLSGNEARELAVTYFLLANISYWNKNYEKSKVRYLRVLELIEKNRNVSEDDYQMAYLRCKCSMSKLGQTEEITQLHDKYYSKPNSELSNAIKSVSGGVINGKALDLVKPPYPQDAKNDRAAGKVEIEVFINKAGRVVAACGKNKSHKSLIEASEAAALNSKFTPTTIAGEPVSVTGVIIYNFAAR